ncbi:MAG: hypothetical protein QOF72_3172 [Blastocatellia bacterium]|nr:hypothetical protein [Blastocatellia bacterium]
MTKGTQRRDLSQIDAHAISRAIHEFNKLGRTKFLRQYGFGRASKFYFLHEEIRTPLSCQTVWASR